ncbi:hypothetical protein HU200_007632 [Digitaria exilis]|uniref:Vacuolar protein sorting-associated protein 28 homolog n=1 Tax=Digitaria exilis TaxID=1010633 RepID=A0A835FLU7_9POAL|nr:hypothetical protein HU200_007632 [Digitaria exilis]
MRLRRRKKFGADPLPARSARAPGRVLAGMRVKNAQVRADRFSRKAKQTRALSVVAESFRLQIYTIHTEPLALLRTPKRILLRSPSAPLPLPPKSRATRNPSPPPQSARRREERDPPAPMEVKLWNDKRERELLESYADLYAIIKATEKLERAYVRDLVSAADYEAECLKLISQFNSLSSSLAGAVTVPRFVQAYRLDCPAALNRLLQSGVPATVELRAASNSSAPAAAAASAASIAHCVQTFITAMDAVKLNMLANDQVRPLLQDVATSMARLGPLLPPDFEGKVKVNEWLGKLHKMGAADELTEQQARQLNFDLDSAYSAFLAALPASM